eukprot:TRINITY_DN2577_c0_g1_i6.p1 TRINITY_DN2577_c0_g1~~TRINITY_DN2577_c0_g1_i6.p1  ORF type:complete len:234 (-),score=11.34 TRINITY_DN2577_c0_g1_i6:245-946(-)
MENFLHMNQSPFNWLVGWVNDIKKAIIILVQIQPTLGKVHAGHNSISHSYIGIGAWTSGGRQLQYENFLMATNFQQMAFRPSDKKRKHVIRRERQHEERRLKNFLRLKSVQLIQAQLQEYAESVIADKGNLPKDYRDKRLVNIENMVQSAFKIIHRAYWRGSAGKGFLLRKKRAILIVKRKVYKVAKLEVQGINKSVFLPPPVTRPNQKILNDIDQFQAVLQQGKDEVKDVQL